VSDRVSSVVGIAVSLLPIFLFLGALVVIDSYKLVALRAPSFPTSPLCCASALKWCWR
jgi:hypothetical protein